MSDSLRPHGLYTVPGIPQARILEGVAVPFSRALSPPRDQAQVSCIAGGFFTNSVWKPTPNLTHHSPCQSLPCTLLGVSRLSYILNIFFEHSLQFLDFLKLAIPQRSYAPNVLPDKRLFPSSSLTTTFLRPSKWFSFPPFSPLLSQIISLFFLLQKAELPWSS